MCETVYVRDSYETLKLADAILCASLYILYRPGLDVIKLEYSLKLKINRNDWLLADTHMSASSRSLHFILSLRMNSSFITSGPVLYI